MHSFTQGGKVYLASVDFYTSIDELYEDVTLTDDELEIEDS